MESCGPRFRQEVGKFKFLNELIKLVSKKHMGDVTPKELQTKILDILFTWTSKYPKEVKIKEAYDMLKTQGIIHQPTKNVLLNATTTKTVSSSLETRPKTMDVREMALRKLVKSKNPKDIEQANLLIQNIVREDERHAQIKTRRSLEMKKVSENVTLLGEMLENYDKNTTSNDELALINELYESCQIFMPMISKLATDTEQNREDLESILETNDHLVSVIERYSQIVVGNKKGPETPRPKVTSHPSALDDILGLNLPEMNQNLSKDTVMKELGDIFSKTIEEPSPSNLNALNSTQDLILQPDKVSPTGVKLPVDLKQKVPENANSKYAALINLEPKKLSHSIATQETTVPKTMQLDLDSLVLGMKTKLLPQSPQENGQALEDLNETKKTDKTETKDDPLLDTKSTKSNDDDDAILSDDVPLAIIPVVPSPDIKPLTEINIDLDNVEPSSEAPRTVLDEKNGLKILLNFAKDRPRPDTLVIVISIINQGTTDVSHFQFDASVKKPAKLRLCPASGTSLKGVKPFRPPADGIMQVLLLSNPTGKPLNMICILSYCVDDDPDPVKESIEVKDLPYVCN